MVALVAGPAFAQTMFLSHELNVDTGDTDSNFETKHFVVADVEDGANGIDHLEATRVVTFASGLSGATDLNDLLSFGGTIELLLLKSLQADATADPAPVRTAGSTRQLVITEIMWGLDAAATGTDTDTNASSRQWIEIYNVGATLLDDDSVRFLFTANKRVARVGDDVTLSSTGTATVTEVAATVTGSVTYTVVDAVSVINRFGSRWALKGQSGRTVATADNPVQNLVSMYRKRSTNPDKTAYNYDKDGKPLGDNFGDGTEGDQWFTSVGRRDISGNFIGTPGTVQQDVGGQVVSAKAPASLPVGSVIINEIYNGDDLQWVELHNTGTAEANVKNWELEAVTPKDGNDPGTIQRVFRVNDADTKIPAGGFLVITNSDPADSVLAGGVDLRDTANNKFNTGASQLYVVENDDDDKWMPEKGFLLILRNGNDKSNHEKVVDIAGNAFDKVVSPTIVTDVWPLRGWTVPGDRDDADWGGKEGDSLKRDAGKTYARIEQKSGGNRLHKDHWRADGMVGGLGYAPDVDMAIAPGTPGYANNAQKGAAKDIAGAVAISEIMFDSGDGRLVQWIELYNSSMTTSVNLENWELEIRNRDTDIEAYVDSSFAFKAGTVILPNQTLLLVSDRSSASDVVPNRVYNLYQNHRAALGLSNRRSVLLSSEGFYLKLRDNSNPKAVVDTAGNVMLEGPRRTVVWALPETGGDSRQSIVRQFGTKAFDGTADMANDGMMASSWNVAQSVGGYYGHRDDIGSPGHRMGSPLPVSLSSFRPVRDQATGEVVIRWATESELNNAGFNILRSETKEGEFQVINVKGIVAGHGTTSEKHVYTYTDATAKPNVVYYYQIEDVSLEGQRTTLRTTHLRGNVSAGGKLTTTWSDLKSND